MHLSRLERTSTWQTDMKSTYYMLDTYITWEIKLPVKMPITHCFDDGKEIEIWFELKGKVKAYIRGQVEEQEQWWLRIHGDESAKELNLPKRTSELPYSSLLRLRDRRQSLDFYKTPWPLIPNSLTACSIWPSSFGWEIAAEAWIYIKAFGF